MAPITHIVAFNAPAEHQQSVTKGFFALKDECKRDGEAYITSIKAGKQVSPEGRDYETTLVFVLEFKTREDINYYIDHDPAHQSFKDAIPGWGVKGAVVLDFVDGEF